jgi:hypothetical protein
MLNRHPVAAFIVGVGSHLVMDTFPHWGCDMRAPGGAEQFLTAAKRDGVLGLLTMAGAVLTVDKRARPATAAAMTGAVLLDLDKPLLHFFNWNPFPASVQRLHQRVQNESPDGLANEIRFGTGLAAFDLVMTVMFRRRAASPHNGRVDAGQHLLMRLVRRQGERYPSGRGRRAEDRPSPP